MINNCFISAQLSGKYLFMDKQSWDKRLGWFLIPWDLGREEIEPNRKKEKLSASRKGLKAEMSLRGIVSPKWFSSSALSLEQIELSAFHPLDQCFKMKILQICFQEANCLKCVLGSVLQLFCGAEGGSLKKNPFAPTAWVNPNFCNYIIDILV